MNEASKKDFHVDEDDSMAGMYLTFLLDRECYGVEIRYVIEIVGIQSITELPEMPEYIKGLINLRGKIIPVIDVRLRFRKAEMEYNDRTCIIVVNINDNLVGLIIDAVAEVLSISGEKISPPPRVNKETSRRYLLGIGKVGQDVKLLLDCEKLLNQGDTDGMA